MTGTKITTAKELANRAIETAKNYKTLYVMGCFGAPMNAKNKTRYTSNNSYNKQADRTAMINAASADTFGFDCVCFIKGLLWGWCGDKSRVYGGATYTNNGVPDISADSMINVCSGISTDFSKIEIGEVVWMKEHIGIYVGNGLSVECTPKWANKVQLTACNNKRSGYNTRTWTKHGKLPYVSYTGIMEDVKTAGTSTPVIVKKTVDELAKEVLDGKWGNGADRKKRLTNAGYSYEAVQNRVNELCVAKSYSSKWTPAVGDIVIYKGNTHYPSANSTDVKKCKGGKAKITQIHKLGSSKHPYHLIKESGGGATVYGWVDAGSFDKA